MIGLQHNKALLEHSALFPDPALVELESACSSLGHDYCEAEPLDSRTAADSYIAEVWEDRDSWILTFSYL